VSDLEARTWQVLQRYGVSSGAGADARWGQAVMRQRKAMWKQTLRKWLRTFTGRDARRGQKQIVKEYDSQWRKKAFDRYRPQDLKGEGGPALSNEAGAAVRLLYLEHALQQLHPASLLEVGCGNGINLHVLAGRFPRTAFTGLEVTPEGCLAAQRVADAGRLPDELRAFAPFPLDEEGAVRRVKVVRGSGAILPFPDRSFDVVMTSLALEQMEEIRERALSEIARVAARAVVMLEPFSEVNASGLRRGYVRTYDYFQGSIADLRRHGLQVVDTMTDMPHKAWLGTAVVIARRAG
jgi:SAM-dependent methyltransferase